MAVGLAGVVDSDSSKVGAGEGMALAGMVGTVASIPLFIAAGSNKRKARLYLKAVPNTVGNIQFDNSNYLAVGITIPF